MSPDLKSTRNSFAQPAPETSSATSMFAMEFVEAMEGVGISVVRFVLTVVVEQAERRSAEEMSTALVVVFIGRVNTRR